MTYWALVGQGRSGVNDVFGKGVMLRFCAGFQVLADYHNWHSKKLSFSPPKDVRSTQLGGLLSGWRCDCCLLLAHSQC